MTKKELIENMENVMMDLVKYKDEYKNLMDEKELDELDQELKSTAKAFNFLLNRGFKNNKETIVKNEWVYQTKLAEKELAN